MRNPKPHDSFFRLSLEHDPIACDVLRICLRPEYLEQVEWDCEVELLGRHVPGWDELENEADAAILVRLGNERVLLQVVEHKSYRDRRAKLQLATVAHRLAMWLTRRGGRFEGTPLIVQAALVAHGEGSGTRWETFEDMAGNSGEEPGALPSTDWVDVVDLRTVDLDDPRLRAESKAVLLALSLHRRTTPATDAELDALVAGYRTMPKGLNTALVRYTALTLEVPRNRWEKAAKRVAGEVGGKIIMNTVVEEWFAEGIDIGVAKGRTEGIDIGVAKGRTEGIGIGKAEAFLQVARQRFGSVPKKRRKQAFAASPEQLEDWIDRLLSAPDIDSVFSGGTVEMDEARGKRDD